MTTNVEEIANKTLLSFISRMTVIKVETQLWRIPISWGHLGCNTSWIWEQAQADLKHKSKEVLILSNYKVDNLSYY